MPSDTEPQTPGRPERTPSNPGTATITPVTAVLRDGAVVEIRAVTPADRERLVSLYARMSPTSIRHRFFAVKSQLTSDEIRFLTGNGSTHVVLAVVAGDTFLGTGRYVVIDDDGAAEVAFEVADAEQGHGVGTLLLEQLAHVARARGIGRFCAQVEMDNAAMLDVFRHCGFAERESCSQGVYDVEMPVTDSEPFQAAVATRAQIAAAAARVGRSA